MVELQTEAKKTLMEHENTAAEAPPAAFATQLSTSSIDEALIMPDEEVPEPESPQGGN